MEEVLKAAGFDALDYDLATHLEGREYPEREYVVQYKESDLDFISRLLEHEGISYHFIQLESDDGGFERVVFSDDMGAFSQVAGPPEGVRYIPVTFGKHGKNSGAIYGEWFGEEAVQKMICRNQLVQEKVVLNDYNYRQAGVGLNQSRDVWKDGFGTFHEHGEHYKDETEGEALAKIRVQEIQCRKRTFRLQSSVRTMAAGAKLFLSGHYRSDFNQEYLVTEVRHHAEQTIRLGGPSAPEATYDNEVHAIPMEMDGKDGKGEVEEWIFRPRRVTQKPRVPGPLHAKVDATSDGTDPELDDDGRYKVRLAFDLSERDDGKASHPIRAAQPYVGADYGMHFPYRKGDEVLLSCIDGDPDRPVITSGAYNSKSISPVVGENQTHCYLQSKGNNALIFDDADGGELLFLHAERDCSIRVKENTFELVGNNKNLTVENDLIEQVKNNHHHKVDRDLLQEITGNANHTVGGKQLVDVTGNSSVKVCGDSILDVAGNQSEEVGGDSYRKASAIVIEADSEITLVVGGSAVVIDSSGVTVAGSTVTLDGSTTNINSGPGSSPGSGSAGSAEAPEVPEAPEEPGTLEAGGREEKEGETTEEEEESNETSWVEIELKDEDDNPLPREPYKVKDADGIIYSGNLDEEGKARVEPIAVGECEVTFPRIDKDKWKKE